MSELRTLLQAGAVGLFEREAADVLVPALADGWGDGLAEHPDEALAALFETAGERLGGVAPLLDLVTLTALAGNGLDGMLPCEPGTTAVAYPTELSGPAPLRVPVARPGATSVALAGPAAPDRETRRTGSRDSREVRDLLVPWSLDGAVTVARFDLIGDPAGVGFEPVGGVDPSLRLHTVRLTRAPDQVLSPDLGEPAWQAAVALTRRALAHELIGLARRMLELTCEYVGQRRQFGHLIGEFQAVRHQLSDLYVAVESASLAAGLAGESGDALDAAVAKSAAGHAHTLAAQTCLQLHGAIGFTAEHPLHRYIRRGYPLNRLLGDADAIDHAVGTQLLSTSDVPRRGNLVPVHPGGDA